MVHLGFWSKLLVARSALRRCFRIKAQDNLSRGRHEVPDEARRQDHERERRGYRPLIRFLHLSSAK